jgi:hypothetical protein
VGCVVTLTALTACWPSTGANPPRLPGEHLTREAFNSGPSGATDIWPLTVDSGTLSCVESGTGSNTESAVVFTTESGRQYALNGTASNSGRYHSLTEIRADNLVSGEPKNATSLIAAGLLLCQGYPPGS